MEGGGETGDFEEDGEDCLGGGGQHRDEGVKGLVLHGHRAAPCLNLVQGQRGEEGAISY